MYIFIRLMQKLFCGKKRMAAVLLCLGLLAGGKIAAQAANFYHIHSESCYKEELSACRARHQSFQRTTATTAHCNNCNASTTQSMQVEWDHCYGTGEEFEMGGIRNCGICGSQTYQWGGGILGAHQVYQKVLVCGKEKEVTGTLWIRNNTEAWTVGEVILEAGVRVLDRKLSLPTAPYSWDGGDSWTAEPTRQVSENGEYAVKARNTAGKIISETIKVKNIDRTGPILTEIMKSEDDWTNQDVVLTFHAEDRQPEGGYGCGLAERPYSYDNGGTYTEENVLTVSGNGSYDVLLIDCLGNQGRTRVEVSNIDKCAPVISGILALQEGWQAENVTLQVKAYDPEGGIGMHEKSFSMDGVNWQEETEFIISENGNVCFYVRDALGNETSRSFEVAQIDKTAPVLEELKVSRPVTEKDGVFVTIQARDLQPDGSEGCGLHEEAYSLDGGKTWQAADGFWVEQGKRYDIRVRDCLLWESEGRVVSRQDFPMPPEERKTEDGQGLPEERLWPEIEKKDSTDKTPAERRDKDIKKSGKKTWKPAPKAVSGLTERSLQKKYSVQEETESGQVSGTEELPAHTMRRPWYKTAAGKATIVGTGALSMAILAGMVFLLFLFSVPVYCVEEKNVLRNLGRVLLHRAEEGYAVYLPDFMLETAVTVNFRIKVSPFLLKRVENARLLVESNEKNIELVIQETMDFAL